MYKRSLLGPQEERRTGSIGDAFLRNESMSGAPEIDPPRINHLLPGRFDIPKLALSACSIPFF